MSDYEPQNTNNDFAKGVCMSAHSGWRCVLSQIGILFSRLALGTIFLAHGTQKIFGVWGGQGLISTVNSFHDNLGIPLPLGYVAVLTEFFGGLGILLGFLSRVWALGLATHMVVSIVKVHWVHGFFINWFNAPGVGHGIEMCLALLGLSLGILFTGPGRYSLDARLFCKCCKKARPEPVPTETPQTPTVS